MRLDQLRYFVQIVDSQSFNKAAQALYITQPALTNAINALEGELGVRLLTRSSKGVVPTTFGKIIYNDCNSVLYELDKKIETWKNFSSELFSKDIVHIASIPVACTYISEEVIPKIRSSFPNIEIIQHEAGIDTIHKVIQEHKNYIILTAADKEAEEQEIQRCKNSGFQAVPLLDDEYCIFLSVKNILAQKSVLQAEDCQQMTLATYSEQYGTTDSRIEIIRNILKIKDFLYLSGRESIMQMIAQDKAAGFFLKKIARTNWYIKENLICVRSIQGFHLIPSTHYLIWNNGEAQTDSEKIVVDFILKNYARFLEG